MNQIFAHAISVRPHKDPDDEYEFKSLLIIEGRGWEGEGFELWLNEDEAEALLVQLGYYLR